MSIEKAVGSIRDVNEGIAVATMALTGIGALIAGIRAVIDQARGAGVDVASYEVALAGFDAAEARVRAQLAEYDQIKAEEEARRQQEQAEAPVDPPEGTAPSAPVSE